MAERKMTRYLRQLILLRTRLAFRAKDYDRAARQIDVLLNRWQDESTLELAAKIASRRGEITAAASYATRRAQLSADPIAWRRARGAFGRIRETDARWQPIVSGPPSNEPATGCVVYLAKESPPFLNNGFCTRTHESLKSLGAAGRDVVGVTMPGFPGVLGIENPPEESLVDSVLYRHLLPGGGELLKSLAHDEYVQLSAQVLSHLVARLRPGLLHVGSGHRGFETALVGNAVARWADIPWIYEVRSFFETTWTSDPRFMERGDYFQRRFATESRMMGAAELVLTLSGPMRDEIANKHGVPLDRIRVVPNAVDLSRFAPKERDLSLRHELGLDQTFTLGYVSNLSHPREGQEVLIEALMHLRREGRPVTVLLVGDGSRRSELAHLARRLGVAAHVVFTGNIPFDQVARYYAQIDLFVVPRVNERAARMVSPMKPFEAMAMRVPVLVADLPALVEIADNGERAHTFRTGDPRALAKSVTVLLDTPSELSRLTKTAAEWVARERSWSAVARGFCEAYDEVLSRSRTK